MRLIQYSHFPMSKSGVVNRWKTSIPVGLQK